jgi:hypothetical protein
MPLELGRTQIQVNSIQRNLITTRYELTMMNFFYLAQF